MMNLKDKEDFINTVKTFMIGGSFIMCLWGVFPYLIHRFIDPFFGRWSLLFSRWLGGIFSCLGYALAVWCVMLFIREGKGTPLPFAPPRRLVIVGPYLFVRNPMVLGTVLFLLGSAMAFESYGLLFYAIAIFVIMHFFVLIEERSLLRRFGASYAAYAKEVPRWWPKIKPFTL